MPLPKGQSKSPGNSNGYYRDYQQQNYNDHSSYSSYGSHENYSYREDFGDSDRPLTKRLGDSSDTIIGFIFNPDTIKFTILCFATFCMVIDLTAFYDWAHNGMHVSLNSYGQQVPNEAPIDERILSTLLRIPILGQLIKWLDTLTGSIIALVIAVLLWFVVQALEIAGRFNLYLPEASRNLLRNANRANPEAPNGTRLSKKAYKMASSTELSILRWLSLFSLVVYGANIWLVNEVRPWLNTVGNPLWDNVIWNALGVFGVEACLILYRGYKLISSSKN